MSVNSQFNELNLDISALFRLCISDYQPVTCPYIIVLRVMELVKLLPMQYTPASSAVSFDNDNNSYLWKVSHCSPNTSVYLSSIGLINPRVNTLYTLFS